MWVISKIGFFNIICQDDDLQKGLLTVKARAREDLERLADYLSYEKIEESLVTDYRYRIKANKIEVIDAIDALINEINYPKTKPELAKLCPERDRIYLDTWGALLGIQFPDEKA